MMNVDGYKNLIIKDIKKLSKYNKTLSKLCFLYLQNPMLGWKIEGRGRRTEVPMKFIQETLGVTRKQAYTYSLTMKILRECNELKMLESKEILKQLRNNLSSNTTQNNYDSEELDSE